MNKPDSIHIHSAVGGFVLEYTDGSFRVPTTEVITSDAKLIKRIREILEQRDAIEKARQAEFEKSSNALATIQLNE